MLNRIGAALLFIASVSAPARADDWPQWLGPQRDGVWREKNLVDSLKPEKPPKARWRVPIAGGYAGPAVANGKVFVTDFLRKQPADKSGIERVHCLDDKDGKVLWTHEYPATYSMDYSTGPRATPTIDGDHVYTLGGEGHLVCLDVATGKPVWSKHFAEDKSPTPTWGFAAHPLIDGDKLICLTGPADSGKLVTAFDKKTGKVLWQALKAQGDRLLPADHHRGGRHAAAHHLASRIDQLARSRNRQGLLVAALRSRPLRRLDRHAAAHQTSGARRPAVRQLVVGWIDGAQARLGRAESERPLGTSRQRPHDEGRPARADGARSSSPSTHIYGVSNGGELRCLDAATGDVLWETYEPTSGFEFSNWSTAFLVPTPTPDKTFLFNEHGDAILAKLSPKGYEETRPGEFDQANQPGRGAGGSVVPSGGRERGGVLAERQRDREFRFQEGFDSIARHAFCRWPMNLKILDRTTPLRMIRGRSRWRTPRWSRQS